MNRRCGDCTLCCKLVPVRELEKLAGERCRFQRHGKGCTVYRTRQMPACCALWSCRWLVEEETAALARPNRSHYVIDITPDFIQIRNEETGEITPIPVVQVWVDPAHPDAHRDPALRAYLERMGQEKRMAALIRYNSRDGFTLFPPALSSDGQWHEVEGQKTTEHTLADFANTFGGVSIEIDNR